MRELAAVISRVCDNIYTVSHHPLYSSTYQQDIYLHNPDVHWDDIIGLDDAKRLVKEAVVYPIKVFYNMHALCVCNVT